MATFAVSLLLIAFVAILVVFRAGDRLTVTERVYCIVSPVPAIVMFILPATFAELWPATEPGVWGARLGWTGWLTGLVLAVAGVGLLIRRSRQGRPWGRLLPIALVTAFLPVALAALVSLMYVL